MPYTPKQVHVAEAVAHGWQPKGSAVGFNSTVQSGAGKGMSFADLVVKESPKARAKKKVRRKYFGMPEE